MLFIVYEAAYYHMYVQVFRTEYVYWNFLYLVVTTHLHGEHGSKF